jgi:hypothetical protein
MNDKKTAETGDSGGLNLCHLGKVITVPPGTRIVSQGESPEFFYVVQSGRVQVFRETQDRIRTNRRLLWGSGPGDRAAPQRLGGSHR